MRLFVVELHSSITGWERLPGYFKQLKHARDAARLYSESTGRVTRTHRCSKMQSLEKQAVDVPSWCILNNICWED